MWVLFCLELPNYKMQALLATQFCTKSVPETVSFSLFHAYKFSNICLPFHLQRFPVRVGQVPTRHPHPATQHSHTGAGHGEPVSAARERLEGRQTEVVIQLSAVGSQSFK